MLTTATPRPCHTDTLPHRDQQQQVLCITGYASSTHATGGVRGDVCSQQQQQQLPAPHPQCHDPTAAPYRLEHTVNSPPQLAQP
jgi:hypothetical protein